MDIEWAMPFKRSSPSWSRHRRLFTRCLNPTTIAKNFSIVQVAAAHRLLASFLSDPDRFEEHIKCASADIILGITYGYDIQPPNDPFVDLAEKALRISVQGLEPKFLVNVFPLSRSSPRNVCSYFTHDII